MVDVLIPYAAESMTLPDGLDVHVWAGRTDTSGPNMLASVDDSDVPEQAVLDRIEYYVIPYGFAGAATSLIARMPRLKAVQTLTAGYEHVVPDRKSVV